jgi:hypothetical protein
MRPKKRVLLYCADEERRDDLAFVLRVRCPWAEMVCFASVQELDEELIVARQTGADTFGCVVLVSGLWAYEPAAELNERIDFDWLMRDTDVALRTIELRAKMDKDRPTLAGRRVFSGDIASLADAMKTASARKRGPKRYREEGVGKREESAVETLPAYERRAAA